MSRHDGAMKVAWYALLGIAFAVPLAVSGLGGGTWLMADAFTVPKILVLSVLLAVCGVAWALGVLSESQPIRFTGSLWWALAFLVVAIVSTFMAVDRSHALVGGPMRQGLVTLILLVIVAFMVIQLARGAADVQRLAIAVMLGGALVSVLALLQISGVDPIDWSGVPQWMLARGVSTLGNPDFTGGYLVFPVVLSAAYALGTERASRKIVGWFGVALFATTCFATLTRGAWIGATVGLVLVGFFAYRGRKRLDRVDIGGIVGAAATLGAAMILLGRTAAPRAAAMFEVSRQGGSGRFVIWEIGLRAIPEYWLLGTGPDSFRFAYQKYRTAEHAILGGSGMTADDAHNYFIMLAVTLGIPALLLALAFLASTLRKAWTVFAQREVSGARLMFVGWLAAVIGHCVYLFFGPATVGTNVILWVGLGVLMAGFARPVESRQAGLIGASAIAITVLAGATIGGTIALADHYVLRSRTAPWTERLMWAQRAAETMPWVVDNHFAVAEFVGRDALIDLSAGTAGAKDSANRAVAAYEELLRRNPHDYEAHVVYADVLNGLAPILGDPAAQRALELATAAEPLFPAGLHWRVQAATALVLLERPEEAVILLADVWDSDPYYVDPATRYAWALLKAGRVDEARDVVERMLELYPDEPFAREFAQQFEVEARAQQQDR